MLSRITAVVGRMSLLLGGESTERPLNLPLVTRIKIIALL